MSEYAGLIGLSRTGQAPINIDNNIVYPRKYPPLILSGHWLSDGEAILWNNGKTAIVLLSGDRVPSVVRGGPLLNDEYEFHNVHFHWGEEDCRGAEHTIDGTWFSMEAHVVHWNRKYGSFEECLKHKDGMCILAYLFMVQPGLCELANPQLERITENLKHIIDIESRVKIPPNSLCWMRSAINSPWYYVYSGSYNDHGNPECAMWIVFPGAIPIRPCQIAEFRKLRDKKGECIKANWRKTQLLKCRKIYFAGL